MLDGEDWKRIDTLLDAALDVPPEEREQWLDARCAGNEALRKRIEELLRFAEDEGHLIETAGALDRPLADELGIALGSPPAAPVLRTGQRLGRYEIRGLLGSGGMSRVYRALDPGLGREVAIKALAEAFRDDAASLRRFEREARALANLNHPNVATIHGFELLDGAPYLVLELVEGETLDERLREGALPVPAAVDVARQVAEALEEAHRKGVVHRDLKPSNVMLGPGGRVKVLDFGVAKALPQGEAGEPRHTQSATAPGAILGTAPYMSPEQVRGDEVDTRTDVWAFGCLLYEMLCGRRAFPGPSIPDVLAAVLRDEVDASLLPAGTPSPVRRLLERCLRKDRHQRLQDIGDARLELEELGSEPAVFSAAPRPRAWRSALPWMAAAAGVATAATALWLGPRRSGPSPPPMRLSLDLPSGLALADDYAAPYAVSPDGSRVVMLCRGGQDDLPRLFLRDLRALELAPLADTEGAWQPFFSADGRSVAFFADRKLKKASLDGGPVEVVADVGGNARGASWAPDGGIILAPSRTSGLVRVGDGAAPQEVTSLLPGEQSHRWPQVLPGGRWVLFTVAPEEATWDEAWLEVVSLATGERKRVTAGNGAHGRYVKSGHIVLVRAGRLHAVPFDLERMEARGAEVALEGVRYDPQNGGAHLAVSASGTLIYSPGIPTSPDRYLAWVDASGRLTRLVDTPRIFREPRLSPDGTRVAVGVGPAARAELWFLDTRSRTLSPGGFAHAPHRPTWRPDGRAVTLSLNDAGRWRMVTVPGDGSGAAITLLESGHRLYPDAWSPDGRFLVFEEQRPETGWDLGVLEVDSSGRRAGEPRPLSDTRFNESNASFSADGRWVAYESDELDGIVEVYVRSFPGGEGKVRASTTGARWPRWGSRSDLYYWYSFVGGLQRIEGRVDGGRFTVVGKGPVWPARGSTDPLADRLMVSPSYAGYDVDASRGRFLMLEKAAEGRELSYLRPVVVPDWAPDVSPTRP